MAGGAKGGGKKGPKDAALQQKSPAELFAENKNIAGFDNVGASTHAAALHITSSTIHLEEGRG